MTGIKVREMAQEHRSAGRDLHQTEQQNPLTGWSREPSELSLPSPRNGAGHPDGAPRPSATAAVAVASLLLLVLLRLLLLLCLVSGSDGRARDWKSYLGS